MRNWPRAALGGALLISLSLMRPVCAETKPAPPGDALGIAGQESGKPIKIEADNGIEWQQTKHIYIARGNAKATRGQTSVRADTLYAYYRPTPISGTAKGATSKLRGSPQPGGLPPGPGAGAISAGSG